MTVENMFKRPKETRHFQILKERVRHVEDNSKPLYKMKMFNGTESRVSAGVKNFKTYDGRFFKATNNGLDGLIEKLENDIKDL
jgi:hypothetical protein